MLEMSINFDQLLPTFIEESLENVEEIEEALLKLDVAEVHAEDINQIFRAVHTIKGNSAIFKFVAINDLAKTLENLLDNIRKQTLKMKQQHLDLLLKSSDCLRSMLLEVKKIGKISGEPTKELITALIASNEKRETKKIDQKNTGWIIHFSPKQDILQRGNHPENLFRELKILGNLSITCDYSRCPEFSNFIATDCYLSWQLKLSGDISKNSIEDILSWGSEASERTLEVLVSHVLERQKEEKISLVPTTSSITSIRVSTEKIDALMNTAEELVITESVLKQISKELNSKILRRFIDNLEDLSQHSRSLQETILRMRMIPIAFAINRFPRMVLDVANQLGKEIEFKISGEQTEIDKTMVEKITDPLMHLIRNAIDHGIESPAEREKNQKNRLGIIELNTYQSGNNIIIDIKDNGRGLDAEKIRKVAINQGIVSQNKILTQEECYQLIFQPGFSTAETVSDISGRGVGLDVVMKNIHELGGKVEVISVENVGTIFRLRLPLTLAIMDCQLIKVGAGFYAIPLSVIMEMFELEGSKITLSTDNTEYYTVREETFKLFYLEKLLFLKTRNLEKTNKFLIKIKIGETIFGFVCDELLFQQQIVIKSIEENYTKIPGILGATVLGDGELALILDVKEIEKLASQDVSIINKIVEPLPLPVKASEIKSKPHEKNAKNISEEYLCFLLENKEYAFNIQDIKEVCIWQKHATLPFSQSYVVGLINLRGKMIPVVDLRILFDLNVRKDSCNTVVIVLHVKQKEKHAQVGMTVDSVTETREIRYDEIELEPEIENLNIKSRVRGIANTKNKIITLLSPDYFVPFSEQKNGALYE